MLNVLLAVSNKTTLLILMGVLIAFIVLLTVLGIVFIIALRKRAPVVKVVMAPPADNDADAEDGEEEEVEEELEEEPAPVQPEPAKEPEPVVAEEQTEEVATEPVEEAAPVEPAPAPAPVPAPAPAPQPEEEFEPEDEDDDSDVEYVKEGNIRVRYEKSFTAKLAQLKQEPKEWYSQLKNILLSYKKVRARMSWKRESFRMGRMTIARFVIRGKTLCLLLAVEPAGYTGTKFAVEDVSSVAITADTPCMYRIKNARRAKYAVEMIIGFMKELQAPRIFTYEEQNFVPAYEETHSLLEKGLIKRIETTTVSPFTKEEAPVTPVTEVAVAETTEEAAETAETEEKPEETVATEEVTEAKPEETAAPEEGTTEQTEENDEQKE